MKVFQKFGFPKLICLQTFSKSNVSQYINEYYTKNSILATFDSNSSMKGGCPPPKYLSVKFLQLEGFTILKKGSRYILAPVGSSKVQRPTIRNWMKFPWTYGSDVQYLKIKTWLKNEPRKHPKWEILKILLQQLPNLKGICLQICSYDYEVTQLNSENISPLYNSCLENHGIENLSVFQFEDKIKETSKTLPFVFHFTC